MVFNVEGGVATYNDEKKATVAIFAIMFVVGTIMAMIIANKIKTKATHSQ